LGRELRFSAVSAEASTCSTRSSRVGLTLQNGPGSRGDQALVTPTLITHWAGLPRNAMTLSNVLPFSKGTSKEPFVRSTLSIWGNKF